MDNPCNMPPKSQRKNEGIRVSVVSIIVNIVLSVLKLFAGIWGHSAAMISDSVHSASDVFSSIIVIVGLNISRKEADETHPYGHERFESIASIILSFMLFAAGIGIGYHAILIIAHGSTSELSSPDVLALSAAIISIVVKETMYHYTMRTAKKLGSPSIKADAWHHRSDALSSVGALIGIGGAMLGVPVLDPIAGIVICIFISRTAIGIFIDASNRLVDRACDEETLAKMTEIILLQQGVLSIDVLHTRISGSKICVETEISVDSIMSFIDAHSISENVCDAIRETFPNVSSCTVHVNPKM